MNPLDRAGYVTRQAARVAWYMGHYFASTRYRQTRPQQDIRDEKPRRSGPGLGPVLEALAALFATDLKNAERGLYPIPRDHDGSPATLMERSRRFFTDVPQVAARKAEGRGMEVFSAELAQEFPAYFLQNFHYQTGGYLTGESAKLYDTQVEILFSGAANGMRRQCLVPIAEYLRGGDQRKMALLDVACGTGRFLRFVKEAFPRLAVTGCDLSQAYLDEAREHVRPYPVDFKAAQAEALPFEDTSFDIVTSIYLFHEVPPPVRREIAREFARVLKPGGLLVFMDSLQPGDTPMFDALLESFPLNFHEPYYSGYLREDLPRLFAEAGLETQSSSPVFLSKLVVARKP
jgi:ubiquinone/menaquinone biosynthesis C-methylase UbiE